MFLGVLWMEDSTSKTEIDFMIGLDYFVFRSLDFIFQVKEFPKVYEFYDKLYSLFRFEFY